MKITLKCIIDVTNTTFTFLLLFPVFCFVTRPGRPHLPDFCHDVSHFTGHNSTEFCAIFSGLLIESAREAPNGTSDAGVNVALSVESLMFIIRHLAIAGHLYTNY